MITIPPLWYAICALVLTNLLTMAGCNEYRHQLKEVKLAGGIAAEQAKATIKEQKQITEDTTNAWNAALNFTRDDWAKRLRNARVQSLPPVSGPAGGVDGLSADQLALAAQCAETTLQLKTLQDWVRKQEKVK